MKDISDAEVLMATARDALLNELLPALPKDRRYAALMIANAMKAKLAGLKLRYPTGDRSLDGIRVE